ncbi:MAG: hypothetical protein Q8O85_12360 [Rhodoferax sp.]|uniref:hypothetical protein n=1 Tax=Rhodoferax sp. TaxID=50421 RepID=UPI002732A5A3|nr:hypothetical protein [Rhodoferax sp.]MDP2679497.1 hypothetical protein [Rhodoferax sp.]
MQISSKQKQTAPEAAAGGWPKWLRRGPLEMLASLIIGLGLFMLLQPFALVLYTWSFVTMLGGTVMFTVVSKFPD